MRAGGWREVRRGLALAAGLLAALATAPPARAAAAELRYLERGEEVARHSLAVLRAACPPERVAVDDPYYERPKAFWALPAACVLAQGLPATSAAARDGNLFLRAADGYVRPARAGALASADAWVAFSDAALADTPEAPPRWEPIDRRQLDPGPFYLIWSGAGQNDPHRFPWPYQLVAVEAAPFDTEYPHLVPGAEAGAATARGFGLFRDQCVSCHSMNGEGGTVGPDLNVPQSIVEYRPVEQIRAFIRDPGSFRLTSMPAHRHLSDGDLDDLVAYFRAMAARKHLPPVPR